MSNSHPTLRREMAARDMRLAHLVWHGVREIWNQLGPDDQHEFRLRFGDAWVPPRPVLDASGKLIEDNGAGLDFLYMHRIMIEHANDVLSRVGAPPVEGWASPPAVGDTAFPVPRSINLPELVYKAKNDACWGKWLLTAEKFRDPAYLADATLAEIGGEIEYGLHAAMHVRWGAFSPIGLRISTGSLFQEVGAKWDLEIYDSLLDPYSAHVSRVFWYLHVWIDGCIDAWEAVHGPVKWQDPWLGPMDGHHHFHHTEVAPGPSVEAPPVEAPAPDPAGHPGHGHHHDHDHDHHHHAAAASAAGPVNQPGAKARQATPEVKARIAETSSAMARYACRCQLEQALGFLGKRGFCGSYSVRRQPDPLWRKRLKAEPDLTVHSPGSRPPSKLGSGHEH